ncbi:carbohydrate ABC transporter permease [Streptomyces sp. PT12]|uniref:carbohydrate ABC transporter permease n=1 Tax=Streptomyces sp. PT12 TaxID=1510197 RepID=UPI000DE24988|nr:sugar ABC transporter permease [Streptomyces sp. PT12]RBM06870.1 sugar ABC transporter permease [Streptomyces sp. PT12]
MSQRRHIYYWMALPAVLLFFVFHTLPALQGVFYSFTDSRGYGDWSFIGFDNYAELFRDPQIRESYRFTLLFAVVATIAANVVSLAIAVGLTSNVRFRGFLRGVYFLPAILATIVVGYIFNFLFANPLPEVGESLGFDTLSRNILGDPDLAWVGVVIVAVWQGCATTIVIYMAGLQTIPDEVREAGLLDGASAWQRFWRITFPLLAPFFTINMVLSLKNFLMVFDQIVALTEGGPGTATQSISYQIYRDGFTGGEFAYQSANAVIYFLVIALISVVQLRFLRAREVSA